MGRFGYGIIMRDVLCFVAAFAVVSLMQTQVITMARWQWNVCFLLAVAVVLYVLFRHVFCDYLRQSHRLTVIALLCGILGIHLIVFYICLYRCDTPVWPFEAQGTSFLMMDNFFLWVKPIDVLVQQMMIMILVARLRQYGMTLSAMRWLFVVGFGAIHIVQIYKIDVLIGILFAVGAVVLSFVFPWMLVHKRYGYLYNYMIHLGVYSVAALVSWGYW